MPFLIQMAIFNVHWTINYYLTACILNNILRKVSISIGIGKQSDLDFLIINTQRIFATYIYFYGNALHLYHYVRFSQFYWHFWAFLVTHICSMLQGYIIAIWMQGLILNSGRSYATFGPKIPVFRANSGCLLGTKWQKWWIYKNVSRIVKIIHSV